MVRQVNQLKSAIQIHNESIQFLKRQNAELKDEVDEAKTKVSLLLGIIIWSDFSLVTNKVRYFQKK